MQGLKKILIGFGALLLVTGLGAGVALAASNDQVVNGVSDHSVYQAGRTVTITGTVNGDIFCAAQTVDIDAVVNGDVICAGQSLTVEGMVHGSVRLAGQSVNLGAKIDRSGTVAAQDFNLEGTANVASDLSLLTQSASINGAIGRDLNARADKLTLNSSVGRDVQASVNRLSLDSGAKVMRNVSYQGPNKLSKSNASSISGSVYYTYSKSMHHGWGWHGVAIGFRLFLLGLLLVFGLSLVALFPQLFNKWNQVASTRVWATLLTGLIAMFVVPAIILALGFTIIGIPLATLVALLWLLAMMVSPPLAAYYTGRLILPGQRSTVLILLVGAIVLGLIGLIPIVGGLVALLALWFGTGSVLLNLKRLYKRPKYAV